VLCLFNKIWEAIYDSLFTQENQEDVLNIATVACNTFQHNLVYFQGAFLCCIPLVWPRIKVGDFQISKAWSFYIKILLAFFRFCYVLGLLVPVLFVGRVRFVRILASATSEWTWNLGSFWATKTVRVTLPLAQWGLQRVMHSSVGIMTDYGVDDCMLFLAENNFSLQNHVQTGSGFHTSFRQCLGISSRL